MKRIKCDKCGQFVLVPDDMHIVSCNPNKEKITIALDKYDSYSNHGFVRNSNKPMKEGDIMAAQTGVIGKVN